MRLWLSKNAGVPLKDQLTRQIILAIISGDAKPGDKLPSVRELGRRNKIHPNTVTAAYRWLEENGWTESRPGSGVYVKTVSQARVAEATRAMEQNLDHAIRAFISRVKERGFSTRQIKNRLAVWLDSKGPKKIVVVEQDGDLTRILEQELCERFDFPVMICDKEKPFAKDALVVSISDLPGDFSGQVAFVKLKLNSVQESISGKPKPKDTDLIGIASHWEQFRRWTETMLVAVGIDEDNLVVRDTNEINWQDGLRSCNIVIADSLTAKKCDQLNNVSVFPLISDESFGEIEALIGDVL
jgi:DNA-binding transcriptional regulator YhcF (GntR family)